ncbi:MAG: ABC transporter substrate-binding protein [Promethearchaeota archaeon]
MKKNTKRGILLLILGSTLALSSFIGIEFGNYRLNPQKNLDIFEDVIPRTSNGQSLVFGTIAGPPDLDPHLAWDSASGDVISQICEGLYKFDVTDPAYPLIPVLATDLPIVEGTAEMPELIIPLRTGVTFHDGTPFNAAAVKWNFDRLCYFLNYSGNQYLPAPFNVPLSSDVYFGITKVYALFTVEGIPVINQTILEGTYTIRIKMNMPKASFVNILTFDSTFMHSPTSAQLQGKELDYLTYADGDVLIGTGPFIYQDYIIDTQVTFTGNPDYWQGAPQLTNLTFLIIEDDYALNQAVLNGSIDLYDNPSPEYYDQFEADPDITLLDGGSRIYINYMGFNGYMVDTEFRKAISYAVNYSYLIDVILEGNANRAKSPIPTGVPMSNYGFNYPVFNRLSAQLIMQSMGYGVGFTNDDQWLAVADSGGWGFGWNITAQIEGTTRRDLGYAISDNLRYLGIDAPVVQISFWDIITCMESISGPLRRDMIPMYILAWAPDYIDPENFITPLYSNRSTGWVNTYDYELEVLMLAGETTVDLIARQAIYDEIQRKLVEELYFHVWMATYKNYDVYQNYVKGWIPNANDNVDLYPVYIELEDIIPPDITVYLPEPDQIFRYDVPEFLITIDDDSPIISMWYTLDGGLTNYTFYELSGTINQTAWEEQESGVVTITFYAEDEEGNVGSEAVNVIKEQLLFVEMVDQSFTEEEFNITFSIYGGIGQPIDFATIEMWWDGVEVSSKVQNLGSGIYFVSLDPITVAPGEDPILLNMTISADGYHDKYFETYLAVDPDVLDKEAPKQKKTIISGYELGLLIIISCGALLMFIRRMKKA